VGRGVTPGRCQSISQILQNSADIAHVKNFGFWGPLGWVEWVVEWSMCIDGLALISQRVKFVTLGSTVFAWEWHNVQKFGF